MARGIKLGLSMPSSTERSRLSFPSFPSSIIKLPDRTGLALEAWGADTLGEARFLEVVPYGVALTIVKAKGRAVNTRVGADRDFLVRISVDALADCWLPPARPTPVGVLAHVDAGAAALGVGAGLALGLELCRLEVGGSVEGLMVPFGVVGEGGRGDVGRGRDRGRRDRGDGRDEGQEESCVGEHCGCLN
jgi:hypothetical protein